MPKAISSIPHSTFHNLPAGEVADQLGALKAEIADLETREKALRDELIHRGGTMIEGAVFCANCLRGGALDARRQGRARRDGRILVGHALPASANHDGCGEGSQRHRQAGRVREDEQCL
jgi:hypothetical protein